MPARRIRALVNSALAPPSLVPDVRPDRELLARFLSARDEVAFAALLRRHGPLVRAVCRGLLRNPADAEDAFQATFLVLVRRAPAIRNPTALGGWLGVVAGRVARRIRATIRTAAPLPEEVPDRPAGERSPAADLREVLDEEIARLPEVYRLAVQACYVTGRTTAEAAAQLGWAKGTVLTRLAWARRRLRSRLAARGVGLAVGAFGTILGRPAAFAVGSALLARATRIAVAAAGGETVSGLASERSITLSEGVARTMIQNKLKWATGVVLVALLTGVGIVRWSLAGEPGAHAARTAVAPARDEGRSNDPPAPAANPPAALPPRAEAPPGRGKQFLVSRPVGTWSRSVVIDDEAAWVSMRFEEDRVTIRMVSVEDRQTVERVVEADYSITKDSVVFGVVTACETRLPDETVVNDPDFDELVDQPFTFRFRMDGDTLTVKGSRVPNEDSELNQFLNGRFTSGAEEAPAKGRGPAGAPGRAPNRVPPKANGPKNKNAIIGSINANHAGQSTDVGYNPPAKP